VSKAGFTTLDSLVDGVLVVDVSGVECGLGSIKMHVRFSTGTSD
jgi:hypothetical protein